MLDSLHDEIGASECKNIRLLLSLLLHESIPNCQVNITEYNLPQINPRVAKQTNAVDCGIFALGFTRLIINHFSELSLKSDILHENSPTYRRQPFTSSHIYCNHARSIITHLQANCKRKCPIFAIYFVNFLCTRRRCRFHRFWLGFRQDFIQF